VKPSFSLMPIGGVGEIGSNHTLVRAGDTDIVIDCGILFPHEDAFDINYLIPDFSKLDLARLKAVVITHGHEDHIGALPHLLALHPELPVYATGFTRLLIQRKCEERKISPRFVPYTAADVLDFGDVIIHPVHVTHSIPETHGLYIHTPGREWGAFYVSDFKYDLAPTREAPFDVGKLRRLMGTCARNAFFIDSTNALVPGRTASEAALEPDLEALVAGGNDRIFVTMFASNVHRMGVLMELAEKHGRRVVAMGRSMDNYARAGIEAGIIKFDVEDLLRPDQTDRGQGRLLVLVSGCQGDFLGALRRLSSQEDANFKLVSSDLVVFSSKVIPGNEKSIARILNQITGTGAEIVTAYDRHIHASGHPAQDDLRSLINDTRPDAYFPIHGETFFLRRHADMVTRDFPLIETRMILNGHEVCFFADGRHKTVEHPATEPQLIHGRDLLIERSQISQRRKLATQGAVFISVDRVRGVCEVSTLGLPLSSQATLSKVKELVMDKIRNDLDTRGAQYATDQLRIAVRQFFQQQLGYKPVTEVHLLT
jgi:ribonuclease J